MISMIGITGNKMMPCPGGTLIKNKDGVIVGAVGISGASPDEDEFSGMYGVLATNPEFKIDPDTGSDNIGKCEVKIENGRLIKS